MEEWLGLGFSLLLVRQTTSELTENLLFKVLAVAVAFEGYNAPLLLSS